MTNEPRQSLPAAQASSNAAARRSSKYVSIGALLQHFPERELGARADDQGQALRHAAPDLAARRATRSRSRRSTRSRCRRRRRRRVWARRSTWTSSGSGRTTRMRTSRRSRRRARTTRWRPSTPRSRRGTGLWSTSSATPPRRQRRSWRQPHRRPSGPPRVNGGSRVRDPRVDGYAPRPRRLRRPLQRRRAAQPECVIRERQHPARLLAHAQATYGPDAQPLLPLPAPDPDLAGEPNLVPRAGALATAPADPSPGVRPDVAADFTSRRRSSRTSARSSTPRRSRSASSDRIRTSSFDPASYFFFQDNRRCYYVESQKFYWTGSAWSPAVPSNPASAPFEVRYLFHRFYHPFTRLFWHQLAGGGFDDLYDPDAPAERPTRSTRAARTSSAS